MKRTLMQLGIGALEEMFTTLKTDAKVLKQLENELQHRQVPRAVALLDQVQLAMKRAASSVLPGHHDELGAPAVLAVGRAALASAVIAPVAQPAPSHVPQQASSPAPKPIQAPESRVEPLPMAPMSMDDSCKLLKVTLASPWQEVELSRRKLVLLSHPRHVVGMTPELQKDVRTEARRVNAAYAVLSTARVK